MPAVVFRERKKKKKKICFFYVERGGSFNYLYLKWRQCLSWRFSTLICMRPVGCTPLCHPLSWPDVDRKAVTADLIPLLLLLC